MAKDVGVFSRLRRLESVDDVAAGYGDTDEVHVLAVDDSLVDRKVIERLLRITSCKVTAVDSGMRALQFLGLLGEEESSVGFDDLKVDLVITDYCMPGMTGYELLKKIKGSSTFREIPVVIMSSENILARIDRCLQEGAEDFIVKPVKLSDVKRLKTCMFGEGRVKTEDGSERFASKRKLQDNGLNVDSVNALQSESCPDDETSSILSPPPSMSCSSGSGSSSSSPSRPSSPIPQDPISHDVIQADQKQEDQGQR